MSAHTFVLILVAFGLATLASLLVAMLRRPLTALAGAVQDAFIAVCERVREAVIGLGARAEKAWDRAIAALDWEPVHDPADAAPADGPPRRRPGALTLIVAALSFAIVIVITLIADFEVAVLRFGAILGLEGAGVGRPDVWSAVLLVTSSIAAGWIAGDLYGHLGDRPPLARIRGRQQRFLRRYAIANCALAIATTAGFWAWGEITDPTARTAIATVCLIGLAALMAGTLIIAGFALPAAAYAIWAILARVVIIACAVVRRLISVMIELTARSAVIWSVVLALLARLGEVIWGWVLRFPASRSHLRLEPLSEPVPADVPEPRPLELRPMATRQESRRGPKISAFGAAHSDSLARRNGHDREGAARVGLPRKPETAGE